MVQENLVLLVLALLFLVLVLALQAEAEESQSLFTVTKAMKVMSEWNCPSMLAHIVV